MVLAVGLAGLCISSVAADIVTLKSQRTVSGVIIQQNDQFIKMDIGSGVPVTYYRDQIESIQSTPLESAFDTPNVFTEPKSFLWQVKTPRSTVYLLGSIHLGKKEMYPLAKVIEDAFAQSQSLVLEVNVDKMDTAALQKMVSDKASYPAGERLANHLPAGIMEKLQAYLMPRGILIDQFMGYKPWYVAMALTKMQISTLGFSEEWGVDRYFANMAKEQGKNILELENIEAQLDFLNDLPKQERFLEYSLVSLSETESMLGQILFSWAKGDAKNLEELLINKTLKESPDMEPVIQKVLIDRNEAMAEKIKGLIQSDGTYFVIVGAAHLVGPKGIVELLNKSGFAAQQL